MADHKRKKKRGRSKLFTSCFLSFAGDERPLLTVKSDSRSNRNGCSGLPVLIAARDREEKNFIPDVNTLNDCVTGRGVDRTAERSGLRRSVSRLLKAVLFDSVMVKKISSSSKSSIASNTNESFHSIDRSVKQSEDSNSCGREPESTDMEDSSVRSSKLLSSSSRTTSSLNSSSSSSSMNSNSGWLSDQKTSSTVDLVDSNHPSSSNSSTLQKSDPINSSSRSCIDQNLPSQPDSVDPKPKRINPTPKLLSRHKGLSQSQIDSVNSSSSVSFNPDKLKSACNNWNIRWCLFLLLSLVVLVTYGRIYSILFTSIWFYLVPCRRLKRVNSATSTARFMDTESEQYKKRVIMAGLLDRTRNPLR
ncbi:hypothetical protein R6Q57_009085 [Mikania cordata]